MFPPTLAVYDVAHSHTLGDIGRVFSSTEDETRRHFSYLSGAFREFGTVVEINSRTHENSHVQDTMLVQETRASVHKRITQITVAISLLS